MPTIVLPSSAGRSEKTIIELAGAAGCGKSYVAQKLQGHADARPYTPKVKPVDYLFLLSILPAMVLIRRDWRRMFRIAARHVLLFRSLARETSGVFVVDEGPWHLLFASYAVRTWNLPKWVLLAACRPFLHMKGPDHVFFLRISPEKLRARRLARSKPDEPTADLDALIRGWPQRQAWIAFLESRFTGDVTVRTFDNDSDESWQDIVLQIMRFADMPAATRRRMRGVMPSMADTPSIRRR